MKKLIFAPSAAICLSLVIALAVVFGSAFAQSFILITPVSVTAEVNNADALATIDENPFEFTNPTYWQAALIPQACITYDLGRVTKVVGFRETSGPFPGNPFTAFVSVNGKKFSQVASGTLTEGAFGEHLFKTRNGKFINARYIKLCVERTIEGGFGELADFRAVGFPRAK